MAVLFRQWVDAFDSTTTETGCSLSISTDAAATREWDGKSVAAESVETDFTPYDLATGEVIQGYAGTAGTVNLTISGYEQSA